jgi:hypothetical protein
MDVNRSAVSIGRVTTVDANENAADAVSVTGPIDEMIDESLEEDADGLVVSTVKFIETELLSE